MYACAVELSEAGEFSSETLPPSLPPSPPASPFHFVAACYTRVPSCSLATPLRPLPLALSAFSIFHALCLSLPLPLSPCPHAHTRTHTHTHADGPLHTVLLFHLTNHYALIFAVRDWEDAAGERRQEVLTARRGQRPTQWVSWTEMRDLMLRWAGHKVMVVFKK